MAASFPITVASATLLQCLDAELDLMEALVALDNSARVDLFVKWKALAGATGDHGNATDVAAFKTWIDDLHTKLRTAAVMTT